MMKVYRYNDMRVRYAYMLAIAALLFLEVVVLFIHNAVGRNVPIFVHMLSFAPLASPTLVFIFIAARALRYKIVLTEDAVVLNRTRIALNEIQNVGFEKDELAFTVEYGQGNSRTVRMGMRESEADIEAFREAARELLAAVRRRNPGARVQSVAGFATPGAKAYENTNEKIREEKAKLTGIGGWLVYLALYSIFYGIMSVSGCVTSFAAVLKSPAVDPAFIGNLINFLIDASLVLFSAMALLSLLRKKPSFPQSYIRYLIYMLAANTISSMLLYGLVSGQWPGPAILAATLGVGTVLNAVWVFAWREYFRRSIRVRNTFKYEGEDVPAAGEEAGR